jgi:hypothetical protein
MTSGRCSETCTPGLILTVSGTGKKIWSFRRRIAGVQTIVSLTLGTYPAHTIAKAREWAQELNTSIERGEDASQPIVICDSMDMFIPANYQGQAVSEVWTVTEPGGVKDPPGEGGR